MEAELLFMQILCCVSDSLGKFAALGWPREACPARRGVLGKVFANADDMQISP